MNNDTIENICNKAAEAALDIAFDKIRPEIEKLRAERDALRILRDKAVAEMTDSDDRLQLMELERDALAALADDATRVVTLCLNQILADADAIFEGTPHMETVAEAEALKFLEKAAKRGK